MSGWQIAAVVVAGGLAAIMLAVAYVLALRLSALLTEAQTSLRRITDDTLPTLREVTVSVAHVNTELERVDAITASVEEVTRNVTALTAVFAATLGGPTVKVAAFSYGVRRALHKRRDAEAQRRLAAQVKAERRAARRARKGA